MRRSWRCADGIATRRRREAWFRLRASIAAEYASHSVRANALAPASTRTDRIVALSERNEHIDRLVREGQPLGWVEPIHVAHMAVYLASDESTRTTGQVLSVDSGATIV